MGGFFRQYSPDLCQLRVMKHDTILTEKAIGLKIAQGVTQTHQAIIWLPKSLCTVVEEKINEANSELWILVEYWIVEKKVGKSYLLDCEVYSNDDINHNKYTYENTVKW